MVADFRAILWKEWRENIMQYGSVKKWLFNMSLIVGVIGIFLPLQLGAVMVESVSMLLWLWMPLFLIMNAIADSIAGERERHTLETLLASRLSDSTILLGKMAVPIFQGWVMTQLSALLAFITVNLANSESRLIMYPMPVIVGVLILPLVIGLLFAGIGVLASTHARTVRQAYQRMIIPLLAMVMLPSFLIALLPQDILSQFYSFTFAQEKLGIILLIVVIIILVFDMGIITVVFRRFHRSRLIAN
jgi:ABC-2 type transport system permease protein